MNPAPADPAAQKGVGCGGGGGEREKAPKCSNQKMRDSEMDELSADVQLFVSLCAHVCVCVRAGS